MLVQHRPFFNIQNYLPDFPSPDITPIHPIRPIRRILAAARRRNFTTPEGPNLYRNARNMIFTKPLYAGRLRNEFISVGYGQTSEPLHL